MTAILCPHCEVISDFQLVWSSNEASKHQHGTYDAAFRCSNVDCRRAIGGTTPQDSSKTIGTYWPTLVGGKDFPDVPESIAVAADEAHRCLSIGANRAAIAMARAVVEATAKDHGVETGNLESKIDALVTKEVIGRDTAEAAHAVRLWGNDAAHGDLALEQFDRADAEEVIVLLDEVLLRAYQSPARIARVKDSRERRKRGEPGGVEDATV